MKLMDKREIDSIALEAFQGAAITDPEGRKGLLVWGTNLGLVFRSFFKNNGISIIYKYKLTDCKWNISSSLLVWGADLGLVLTSLELS